MGRNPHRKFTKLKSKFSLSLIGLGQPGLGVQLAFSREYVPKIKFSTLAPEVLARLLVVGGLLTKKFYFKKVGNAINHDESRERFHRSKHGAMLSNGNLICCLYQPLGLFYWFLQQRPVKTQQISLLKILALLDIDT